MKKPATEDHPIPYDFGYAKHPNLRAWITTKYPQLEPDATMEAFIDCALNFKKEVAKNWEARFRTCVRMGVENGWTSICKPRKGQEVDVRWQEILTHAKAIGCPLERRTIDTAETFRTRVNNWAIHDKPRNVIDFGSVMKGMR